MQSLKSSPARWFRAVDLPSTKPQIFEYKPQRVPKQYEAFSRRDSARIEKAWSQNNFEPILVEQDGLLSVDLKRSLCVPTFWDGPGFQVCRALWFEVLGNNKIIPIDKKMEAEVEKHWHEQHNVTGTQPKKTKSFDLAWEGDSNRVVKCEFNNDMLTVTEKDSWLAIFKRRYFFRGVPKEDESHGDHQNKAPEESTAEQAARLADRAADEDLMVDYSKRQDSSRPVTVRKVKVRPEYRPRKIKHLVFCIHGIGQLLSLKFEQVNFVKDVDELRVALNKSHKQMALKNPLIDPDDSGIQVIPILWRHKLSDEINGIKPGQLFGSSNLAADAVLDFVMYTSGKQRQLIQEIAVGEMREIYARFCKIHPDFAESPKVSVVGHSLGAVIAYDLICRTKQDLGFEVENLFTLGSPLGVLELIKREPLEHSGRAKSMYNILRLADPVATRLEPLVSPKCLAFRPKPLEGGGTNLLKQFRDLTDDIVSQSEFLANKASWLFRIISSEKSSQPAEESSSQSKLSSLDPDQVLELKKFNRHGRLDFSVQESIDISLLLGLAGHLMYLDNPDVVQFILKELLRDEIK